MPLAGGALTVLQPISVEGIEQVAWRDGFAEEPRRTGAKAASTAEGPQCGGRAGW